MTQKLSFKLTLRNFEIGQIILTTLFSQKALLPLLTQMIRPHNNFSTIFRVFFKEIRNYFRHRNDKVLPPDSTRILINYYDIVRKIASSPIHSQNHTILICCVH